MKFLIYGLVDPRTDEVRYVGKSARGLRRAREHGLPSYLAKSPTHKGNWILELKRAGYDYKITVLEEVESVDSLNDREIYWIAKGRAANWPLTNQASGGQGANFRVPTEEMRERFRIFGRANKGRPLSEETRRRMSISRTGVKLSAEHVSRIKKTHRGTRGLKFSDETKLKMSAAHGGRPIVETGSGRRFETLSEAASTLGLRRGNISNVLKGRQKTTRGLRFIFAVR